MPSVEVKPKFSREFVDTVKPMFNGERETFASVLLAALIKAYGPEVLEWDGLTIQLQVKDDLGVEMPRRVYDQLMALLSALTTTAVYTDVAVFDETISGLNRKGIGTEQDAPSVDDMAWAVAEIGINDPEPVGRNAEQPWGPNIRKYARAVLDDEGMPIAPTVVGWAADRPIAKEGMDDASYYAGAWGNQQERANEIDTWIEGQMGKLIADMQEIGIEIKD